MRLYQPNYDWLVIESSFTESFFSQEQLKTYGPWWRLCGQLDTLLSESRVHATKIYRTCFMH